MNFWVFSCSLFLTVLFETSLSFCTFDNNLYTDCSPKFNCGKITDLGFPFWGENRPASCGFPQLKLSCQNNVAKIKIMKVNYRVLEVNLSTRIFRIARDDYSNGICPETQLINTTLDSNLFEILTGYGNLTLFYGCDSSLFPSLSSFKFDCPVYGNGFVKFGDEINLWSCRTSVVIPVRGDGEAMGINILRMEEAILDGFEVKWKVNDADCEECVESSGVCGYDLKLNRSTCFCASEASPSPSPSSSSSSSSSSGMEACQPDIAGRPSAAMPDVMEMITTVHKQPPVELIRLPQSLPNDRFNSRI